MRYMIRTMLAVAFLLGTVALVTHESDAQNQPDPSTALRCNPHENPSCPDWDPIDRGSNETEKKMLVTYDRSRKQRSGEEYSRYKDRRYFVEHFEQFVEQSKISEEQVRRILLALYDYQEKRSALVKSLLERGQTYDGSICPDSDDGYVKLSMEYFENLIYQLDSILTDKQMRVWDQTCVRCHSRVAWHYDDHILKLARK